jgi:hypothetical protein
VLPLLEIVVVCISISPFFFEDSLVVLDPRSLDLLSEFIESLFLRFVHLVLTFHLIFLIRVVVLLISVLLRGVLFILLIIVLFLLFSSLFWVFFLPILAVDLLLLLLDFVENRFFEWVVLLI